MEATGTNTAVIRSVMAIYGAADLTEHFGYQLYMATDALRHLGVHRFHHHDRIIHHDTDREYEGEERDQCLW